MPLFMMISGYFTYFNIPLKQFLKKKTHQLIIPTLTWGFILCFLYDGIMVYIGDKPKISIGKFVFCFWFIKSLFICNIVCYIGFRYMSKFTRILFFLTVMFVSNKYLQITYMLPCFLCGYLYRLYSNSEHGIERNLKPIKIIFLPIFVLYILLLCFWEGTDVFFKPITLYEIFGHKMPLCMNGFILELYHIAVNLVGASFFFVLFKYVICVEHDSSKRFLEKMAYVGRFTMIIYIVQTFFIEEMLGRTVVVGIINGFTTSSLFKYFIMFPLIILLTIIMSLTVVRLCKHNKILNAAFLGRN